MGSTAADYDGDGNLDIFKTNFSDDTSTLYHNNGDGTFTDTTFAAGLGINTDALGWGVALQMSTTTAGPICWLSTGTCIQKSTPRAWVRAIASPVSSTTTSETASSKTSVSLPDRGSPNRDRVGAWRSPIYSTMAVLKR